VYGTTGETRAVDNITPTSMETVEVFK